jgi:hypothetical protein
MSLQNVGPGWAERAVAQLEADIKAGAVGVGEIPKSLGLTARKADGTGSRLTIPSWTRSGKRPAASTSPCSFTRPSRRSSSSRSTCTTSAGSSWRSSRSPQLRAGQPTFEQLMQERDNVFKRHPKTRFVAAHFGWYANDLRRPLAARHYPNVVVEVGAVLYDLGRQPRARSRFLRQVPGPDHVRQGRLRADEYPYYWRVFETKDEYFDYYRDYHAFWKLYGMDLPDVVSEEAVLPERAARHTRPAKTGWPN